MHLVHSQAELHSMCSIHSDKVVSAELMAMSGGWGGRGQGLGLLACVTGRVENEEDDEEQASKGPLVSTGACVSENGIPRRLWSGPVNYCQECCSRWVWSVSGDLKKLPRKSPVVGHI